MKLPHWYLALDYLVDDLQFQVIKLREVGRPRVSRVNILCLIFLVELLGDLHCPTKTPVLSDKPRLSEKKTKD